MTIVHCIVLALGVAIALVLCDLLERAGIGTWIAALATIPLVVAAGWYYSAWLAALSLGYALGISVRTITIWSRRALARRHERAQQRDATRANADRSLKG